MAAENNGKEKKLYEMTISPELFEQWKDHKRWNDLGPISKLLGCSKPTASRALKYGHVLQPGYAEKITRFFVEREEKDERYNQKLVGIIKKPADQQ